MKTREICELNFTLRTTTEAELEPDYTFTGGIEIKLKDGREYCLDFTNTISQDYSHDEDGHVVVEVCQRWLDHDYVKASNEQMKLEEMIDIEFLENNAVSIAIYFEVEAEDEEEYEAEFEVTSCTFRAIDEEDEIDFSNITTLQ